MPTAPSTRSSGVVGAIDMLTGAGREYEARGVDGVEGEGGTEGETGAEDEIEGGGVAGGEGRSEDAWRMSVASVSLGTTPITVAAPASRAAAADREPLFPAAPSTSTTGPAPSRTDPAPSCTDPAPSCTDECDNEPVITG